MGVGSLVMIANVASSCQIWCVGTLVMAMNVVSVLLDVAQKVSPRQ